jgi:tetratricopeptide (TPR) repeat protein
MLFSTIHTVGMNYLFLGEYLLAEQYFLSALEKGRRVFGENHPDFVQILNNLAILYYYTGNYVKAESYSLQAIEIGRYVLGENHEGYASCLLTLSVVYLDTGNYDRLEPILLMGSEKIRKIFGEDNEKYAIFLGHLSSLYAATNRQKEALALEEKIITIDNKIIDVIFPIASERQRLEFITKIRIHFFRFLSLVVQDFSDSQSAVNQAFNMVLQRKAIVADAQLAEACNVG